MDANSCATTDLPLRAEGLSHLHLCAPGRKPVAVAAPKVAEAQGQGGATHFAYTVVSALFWSGVVAAGVPTNPLHILNDNYRHSTF